MHGFQTVKQDTYIKNDGEDDDEQGIAQCAEQREHMHRTDAVYKHNWYDQHQQTRDCAKYVRLRQIIHYLK